MSSNRFFLQSKRQTRIAQNLSVPAADLHHATIKTESPLQLRAGWQFSAHAASLQPLLSHGSEAVFEREPLFVMKTSQSFVMARAERIGVGNI